MQNKFKSSLIILGLLVIFGCEDESYLYEDRVRLKTVFEFNIHSAWDPVITFEIRQNTVNENGDVETSVVAINSNPYANLDSVTYVTEFIWGPPYNEVLFWHHTDRGLAPSEAATPHILLLDEYCCYPDLRRNTARVLVISHSVDGGLISNHPYGGVIDGSFTMKDTTGTIISHGTFEGYITIDGTFVLKPQTNIYDPVRLDVIKGHMSYEGVLQDAIISGWKIYEQTGLELTVPYSQPAQTTQTGYQVTLPFEYPLPFQSLILDLERTY